MYWLNDLNFFGCSLDQINLVLGVANHASRKTFVEFHGPRSLVFLSGYVRFTVSNFSKKKKPSQS